MEEVMPNSEVQEVAPQATASHEEPVEQPTVEKQQLEDKQERNWKAMRERQRELERELKLYKEVAEKALLSAPQQPVKKEIDELDAIPEDEFIPVGQVKKLVEKKAAAAAQKAAKEEAEKLFQQQHNAQFLQRLQNKFNDFSDVVNSETIALLEENEPELAESIAELKDPYKMGVQSYKYIKALKLEEQSTSTRRKRETEKKLVENTKTVQTPQAYDKRPMAQAFKLTKAEESKLYEEMINFARMAG